MYKTGGDKTQVNRGKKAHFFFLDVFSYCILIFLFTFSSWRFSIYPGFCSVLMKLEAQVFLIFQKRLKWRALNLKIWTTLVKKSIPGFYKMSVWLLNRLNWLLAVTSKPPRDFTPVEFLPLVTILLETLWSSFWVFKVTIFFKWLFL